MQAAGSGIERVTEMKMLWTLAAIVALAVAGCDSGTQIAQRVTAIPPDELTASPSPQPSPTALVIPEATAEAVVTAAPTALPLATDLPLGSAMEISAATDTALVPTPRSPLAFDQSPVPIRFSEFYDGFNLRTGLVLSDKLVSLDGQQVVMEGYMAPPLKPELDYFVLTRVRLAFCPFCSTAADWPDDIALVYLPDETTNATELPVRITGRMEVGASVDQETGMVSLVRIYADQMEHIQ